MKTNKLRELFQKNLPTVSTRLWSTDPFFYEAAGQTGYFDYVEFVAENAPFDMKDLPNLARACELNDMGSMIKVDFENRGYVAQKAVQAGFHSILFVDHLNAEQVRESVDMVRPKFPGETGLFGYPNARYIGGQSHIPGLQHVDRLRDIVIAVMIEKAEAVENIEEICSVPGVDMIQFGPNDYCLSRGWNRKDHMEEAKAAERLCIECALRHGIRPRCEIGSPEEAEYYISLGVRDFSLSDQMNILKNFWNTQGKKMREIALSASGN